jgi:hypothetical protein
VAIDGWPDRLAEYYPNYFSFFLVQDQATS